MSLSNPTVSSVWVSRCAACLQRPKVPARASKACAGSDETISGLQTVYCDQFVCDSSPQVERAIRAFAKDVERAKSWTLQIVAEDVKFGEPGIVNVQGKQMYRNLTWNQDNFTDYKTSICSMAMVDNENAEITWSWEGKAGPFDVSGQVTSKLLLNVLTGRIMEHTDTVELAGNPFGQLFYRTRKWAWGQKLQAQAVGDSVDRALDRMSMDEQQDSFMQDPTDPTRFSQQQDTTFNDAVQYAIFLAILWAMWQAYSQLGALGF